MGMFRKWLFTEGPDLARMALSRFASFRDRLLRLGIDPESLRYLAQGDKGSAFSTNGKVVKITEDRGEAAASYLIQGKDLPGLNKIYYVGKLPKAMSYQGPNDPFPISTQYYVIVQDRLDTSGLKGSDKVMADLIGDKTFFTNSIPKNWNHQAALDEYLDEIPVGKISRRELLESGRKILRAFESARSAGIEKFDISSENIGYDRSGNLKLFDLGLAKTVPVDIEEI